MHACMCVCVCLFMCSMHLYQWSDRVVRTVVRPDWKVRSGHIAKSAYMVVTPAVTVSTFVSDVNYNMYVFFVYNCV